MTPLKLMYITNRTDVAKLAEESGVDRVFVDLEYIGKNLRQGGMNTVQSHHTLNDVLNVSKVLTDSELLVRVNPIHSSTKDYCASKEEIDTAINNGADIIMLPYFKTVMEVAEFIEYVDGRAKTIPLLETVEAAESVDEILNLEGLDEMFVGLNDLSLGYRKKFMFELLSDGTVESLADKFNSKGIIFGFGGIASVGSGMLPAEKIIAEHYRLGSSSVILSRSFCDASKVVNIEEISSMFHSGVLAIREQEAIAAEFSSCEYEANFKDVKAIVEKIVTGAL